MTTQQKIERLTDGTRKKEGLGKERKETIMT